MILVITHKLDFTADFVINKLNQRGIKYKRFNCEDFYHSPLTVGLNGSFHYSILGEGDFQSVWFRRTQLPQISHASPEERLYVLNETDTFFKNLFLSLPAKWLSSPKAIYAAENKLLQLKVAQEIGFTIPDTIITNSPADLKAFSLAHSNNIIIKPISQTKIGDKDNPSFIFTNTFPPNLIDEIDKYDLTPCIFQENISKEYEIRTTVVGEDVFSAAVYSQSDPETRIDWRRKKLDFVKTELPSELRALSVQLLRKLNLEFGAIDFIRTPDGKYVFLEINPNGQWAWIENQTGLEISESIINFLTS